MERDKEIKSINIEDIIPNRFQPRLSFEPESMKELAESIKQYGIFQPLVVRGLSNKYEIIAGERRYKAAVMAGLKEVPCIVINIDDNESAEIALVENLQRKDLTPIEEAKSYQKLLDRGYITQEQLAKRMGRSQPAVANKIRLLNLCDEVQDALLESKISERHARSLLSLKEKDLQIELLNKIIENRMTVKDTDDEIKKMLGIEEVKEEKILTPIEEKIEIKEELFPSFIPINFNEEEIIEPKEETLKVDIMDLLKIVPIEEKIEIKEEIPPVDAIIEEKPEQTVDLPVVEEIKTISGNEIENMMMDISETKETIQNDIFPISNEISPEEIKIPIIDYKEIEQPLNIEKAEVKSNIYVTNNLRTAINTVRDAINILEKFGFKVDKEEEDLEKYYQFNIKINKTDA